jgi:tetratricopeptide (TPR) repeat protein
MPGLWTRLSLPIWITIGVFNLCLIAITISVVASLRSPQPDAGLSSPPPVQDPADPAWIGKRVVPKSDDFKLQAGGRRVEMQGGFSFFQVLQTKGLWVELRAEEEGSIGWVLADQVILVEHGLDFFAAQIRTNPRDAFSLAARGSLWRDKRQFDIALRDFDEAIRLDPTRAWLRLGRGMAWLEIGQGDRAISDFDEAIRLDPQNANGYYFRGCARWYRSDRDGAFTDVSEAIRLDPGHAQAHMYRGEWLLGGGKYDKALPDFTEAIRINPRERSAYQSRAMTWRWLGEYDRAILDYNEVIRLNPQDPLGYYSRGCTWATKGKGYYDLALKDYNEAIRLSPQDSHSLAKLTYLERAKAWRAMGRIKEAADDERMAAQLTPK